jgi:hypothetical protein
MKLSAPRWLAAQRLSPEDREEIAAAEPDYLAVTFVCNVFGTPRAFQCSIYDLDAELVARGHGRSGIEAFHDAQSRIVVLPAYAEWNDRQVEVVA